MSRAGSTTAVRRLRPSVLLAGAALAAVACGLLVQDAAAGEETARLNPRVAALLAHHVHPDEASKAVSISRLVEPPGLWYMVAMAVMFLYIKNRGGSTARIATAAGASLAIAAVLDAALRGWDGHQLVSLGTAAVTALGITTILFAGNWLEVRRAAIAVAAIGVTGACLVLALAIVGQPFTAMAAGACLGAAVAGTVEAAARLRWGRWLADRP